MAVRAAAWVPPLGQSLPTAHLPAAVSGDPSVLRFTSAQHDGHASATRCAVVAGLVVDRSPPNRK